MFKYGIIEDLATVRRIPVGWFWGVRLLVTPLTWFGPVFFLLLHLLLNLWTPQPNWTARLYHAFIFVLAVEAATILHAFGHILSGKLVRSAMDELLITTTRDVNLYHGDQDSLPGTTHLARALGGPLFNLGVAGLLGLAVPPPAAGFWADLYARLLSVNLFFGLGGLLPIPSVDGEVIWREVRRMLPRRG
jgi:hypothetical protein